MGVRIRLDQGDGAPLDCILNEEEVAAIERIAEKEGYDFEQAFVAVLAAGIFAVQAGQIPLLA